MSQGHSRSVLQVAGKKFRFQNGRLSVISYKKHSRPRARKHDNCVITDDNVEVVDPEQVLHHPSSRDSSFGNVVAEAQCNQNNDSDSFTTESHEVHGMDEDDLDESISLSDEVKGVAEKFLRTGLNHGISINGIDALWKVVVANKDEITGDLPISMRYAKRKLQNQMQDGIKLTYSFRDLRTGELITIEDDTKISISKFPQDQYKMAREHVQVQLNHIIDFHMLQHENQIHASECQLWNDGLQESRERNLSLDIFAIRFPNCQNIYPLSVSKVYEGETNESSSILNEIVQQLNACGIQVTEVIADAPKRKELMKMMSYNSYYGCDNCLNKGFLYKPPATGESRSYPGRIVWPASTRHGFVLRTKEDTINMATRLGSARNRHGVMSRSPLFDLINFDPIKQLKPEIMHMGYLGVCKHIVKLSLNIHPNYHRKRKLIQTTLDKKLRLIKVPSELARTRPIDGSYKAKHYRDIALLYFPLVWEHLQRSRSEQKIWAYMAFILKAYSQPEREFELNFNGADDSLLRQLAELFYDKFERTYGEENCTYNIHQFFHINELASRGPIQKTSAMPFECNFLEVKRSFHAGTFNVGKQIVHNILLKYEKEDHKCFRSMKLNSKSKGRSDDTLIYIFKDDGYEFFKIRSLIGTNAVVSKIRTSKSDIEGLPWEKVGFMKFRSFHSETQTIKKSEITGKAIKVDCYIEAIPETILFENK